MTTKYKSFAEALSAPTRLVAANDNKKPRKKPESRYRGTLPALRWLYDNHPDLAEPVAAAVRSLSATNWSADAIDNDQDIRPTIGELIKSATDEKTGEWLTPSIETNADGNTSVRLGALRFIKGELVEYGQTKKGRKLQPRDRIESRGEEHGKDRDPSMYIFRTGATTPSPLHTESQHRPFSAESALAPMYDPQSGVEEGRALLRSLGVDGSVPFDDLPFPATKRPDGIAKGADFMGGVVQSSGTASSGAVMWEAPEVKIGEARKVIEDVASGATLKEIGERMGFVGARVDRMAKAALLDAAKAIIAANDNGKKKKAA